MKKFIWLLLAVFFLGGCSSLQWAHWKETGEIYKSGQHLLFSMKESFKPSRKPTSNEAEISQQENWFGDPIQYE